jgi:hypothetical protein
MKPCHLLFLCSFVLVSGAPPLAPAEQSVVDAVSARQLEAHVSFLASDALEGRDTPSKGLDAAAEYIASQFRRLGIEPANGDSYFQAAPYFSVRPTMQGFELTFEQDGKKVTVEPGHCGANTLSALSLEGFEVTLVRLESQSAPLPEQAAVAGKAVVIDTGGQRAAWMMRKRDDLLAMGPAVVLTAGPVMPGRPRLVPATAPGVPVVTVNDEGFRGVVAALAAGTPARVTVKIPAPAKEELKLRNVAGLLRGGDPKLKDTYVVLSAHYDHVGVLPQGTGDRINNGANDDASGVATVLAAAEAMTHAGRRPARSVVFALWFGEEKGLLGSRYYVSHPLFPLASTVADLNFEQMGRTDDPEGSMAGKLTATGYDYSTLGSTLEQAASATGITAWKHERNSDNYFAASDNQAFADAGVPAATIVVAYKYPDYHRPGDEWQKLDYQNFEREARTAALMAWRVAESAEAPRWNESNPKAERYVKAWRALAAGK